MTLQEKKDILNGMYLSLKEGGVSYEDLDNHLTRVNELTKDLKGDERFFLADARLKVTTLIRKLKAEITNKQKEAEHGN